MIRKGAIKQFLLKAYKKTQRYGVRIHFRNSYQVPYCDGVFVDAYFDSDEKLILVAKQRSDWLSLFVHEYSHFEQWMENKVELQKKDFIYDKVDAWIARRIELPRRTVRRYLRYIRDQELDCEQRAAATIEKWGLPIDLCEYIKRANVYIYSHLLMERHRIWGIGSEGIWRFMPAHFNNNYNRMPRGLAGSFLRKAVLCRLAKSPA